MLRFISSLALVLAAQISFAFDPSSMVDFHPQENPIVVNADLTIGEGQDEVRIRGPWYLFKSTLTNHSPVDLIVATYKITVTGVKNGNVTTNEYIYEIDGGMYCVAHSICPELEPMYIDALPAHDTLVYDVKIELEGWFEDASGKIMQRYNGLGSQTTR